VASDWGSTFIKDTVCGVPCARTGLPSPAARTAAPTIRVIKRVMDRSFDLSGGASRSVATAKRRAKEWLFPEDATRR
jgi:hypothetical protein